MTDDPPASDRPPEPGFPAALARRFAAGEAIGQGAFGVVYRAEDRRHHRPVAVKVLRFGPGDAKARARFAGEAKRAATTRHPNLVEVYDSGVLEDGTLYLVTEYLPGGDVASRLAATGPPPVERRLGWAAGLCEGLAALHEAGLVHRDLKPENLLLSGDDELRIADFGLALELAPSAPRLTDTGKVVGTPRFLAPDVLRGLPQDQLTEVWSAGAVLFELLYLDGWSPTAVDAAFAARLGRYPALDPVLRGALTTDRGRRYPDAVALRDAWRVAADRRAAAPTPGVRGASETFEGRPAIRGRADPVSGHASRSGRRPALASAGAAAILAFVGLRSGEPPPPRRDDPPPATSPAPPSRPARPGPERREIDRFLAALPARPTRRIDPIESVLANARRLSDPTLPLRFRRLLDVSRSGRFEDGRPTRPDTAGVAAAILRLLDQFAALHHSLNSRVLWLRDSAPTQRALSEKIDRDRELEEIARDWLRASGEAPPSYLAAAIAILARDPGRAGRELLATLRNPGPDRWRRGSALTRAWRRRELVNDEAMREVFEIATAALSARGGAAVPRGDRLDALAVAAEAAIEDPGVRGPHLAPLVETFLDAEAAAGERPGAGPAAPRPPIVGEPPWRRLRSLIQIRTLGGKLLLSGDRFDRIRDRLATRRDHKAARRRRQRGRRGRATAP